MYIYIHIYIYIEREMLYTWYIYIYIYIYRVQCRNAGTLLTGGARALPRAAPNRACVNHIAVCVCVCVCACVRVKNMFVYTNLCLAIPRQNRSPDPDLVIWKPICPGLLLLWRSVSNTHTHTHCPGVPLFRRNASSRTRTHARAHARAPAWLCYVCIPYVCVCMYICIYTCIYIYIYI